MQNQSVTSPVKAKNYHNIVFKLVATQLSQ